MECIWMDEKKNDDQFWTRVIAVAGVIVAVLSWMESFKAREETARQAKVAIDLQRQIADDQDHREVAHDRQQRTPMLIVQRCCNQVPIAIATSEAEAGPSIILRRLKQTEFSRIDDDVRARCERAFIAKIVNIGPGVAIGSKAIWEIEEVVYADGRVESAASDDVNGHVRPYLWPATLPSGESAEVVNLPHFLVTDVRRRIVSVSGNILLTCDDIDKRHHEFRQPFTMSSVYSGENANDEFGVRFSFHFYEPGSEAKPHTTAKPPLLRQN
jgi:hypothetical protein